ncbi:MAG: hypothetical protein J6P40_07490, partial [Oscillospiraceae bacterium]|nr:hypothetical protein [Oscillospiraceae bacterium]
ARVPRAQRGKRLEIRVPVHEVTSPDTAKTAQRDGCYKTVFRLFAFHSRLEHDKITAYEQSCGGAGWTKSNNTMKLYR